MINKSKHGLFYNTYPLWLARRDICLVQLWLAECSYGMPSAVIALLARYGMPSAIIALLARYGMPSAIIALLARYGMPSAIIAILARYDMYLGTSHDFTCK